MTVELMGPSGGVIEVADDAADRFLAAGYTQVKAKAAPKAEAKPEPERIKPKSEPTKHPTKRKGS